MATIRKIVPSPILVMLATFVVATAVLLLLASSAEAGHCQQFFVQKVVAVPVVAYPQVYYQAGVDLQAEALAEKVARKACCLT